MHPMLHPTFSHLHPTIHCATLPLSDIKSNKKASNRNGYWLFMPPTDM